MVSWNTRDLLQACLRSLEDDAESGLAEVWVVDNASSDDSAAMVRERFPWAHLIASSENLGFGAAVNAVAERTDTPWLVPANADISLEPGALRTLIAEGERHPRAAILAPRLILPDGQTQHSVYPLPTIPYTLAYATGAIAVSPRLARYWCIGRGFDPARPRTVGWAVGAFILVRRSAWDSVGGFDEAQWMYAEDVDLGWRVARAGWETRYVAQARVRHDESAGARKAWGDERYARWHKATYAWIARRRGLGVARSVAAIHVTSYLIRAILTWPVALLGVGSARDANRRMLDGARAHAVGLRSIRRNALTPHAIQTRNERRAPSVE